jgi:hypothetical protein
VTTASPTGRAVLLLAHDVRDRLDSISVLRRSAGYAGVAAATTAFAAANLVPAVLPASG